MFVRLSYRKDVQVLNFRSSIIYASRIRNLGYSCRFPYMDLNGFGLDFLSEISELEDR
jgi:hypothetical protein